MTAGATPTSFLSRLMVFAGDIKISHTVFALPWALLSMVLAGKTSAHGLTVLDVGLILLCMVTARTAAMSANRILDARLDAANPRTKWRAIPGGVLPARFFFAAWVLCAAGFVAACGGFWWANGNRWPVILSPLVLAFVSAYPLLKRFTRLCHYYLGAALGLAPVCAWVAIRGDIAPPPLLMGGAVLLWTAGFDIIYACQDFQSDRELGVFSVPAKLGIARALWLSRLTHAACLGLLVLLGLSVPQLGVLFWIAVAMAAALLVVEHNLVKPDDLSKVGLAFFTVNGVISLMIGALGILDVLRR